MLKTQSNTLMYWLLEPFFYEAEFLKVHLFSLPTALTPKVHLTVVANQGTLEMATTVQVGPAKSFLYFL